MKDAALFFASAATLFASPAQAHDGTGLAGGFMSGFLHPLGGLDHMLAMVAVGLWGAFLGRPLVVVLPVIFPTVMALGAVLGMANVPIPPVEWGIAFSVVVLGALIAGQIKTPIWLAAIIVAVFAIFHGYAHGQELPSTADPVGYSAGFVLSTGLLHVAGIALALLHRWRAGVLLTRAIGGLIGLSGLWFVYRATGL